jgi:hypothetical protein
VADGSAAIAPTDASARPIQIAMKKLRRAIMMRPGIPASPMH